MKNLIVILAMLSIAFVNVQAFQGKGDNKFQVGANFQDNASGLNVSYDFGVGENISLGLSSTYALNVDDKLGADFGDRF
jgi:outer membrane protein G